MESKKRIAKFKAQEKALFDYILADTIGRSIARVYSASNNLPPIHDIYPSLFDADDMKAKQEEQKIKLSEIRFKKFAQAFNQKFNNGGANVE